MSKEHSDSEKEGGYESDGPYFQITDDLPPERQASCMICFKSLGAKTGPRGYDICEECFGTEEAGQSMANYTNELDYYCIDGRGMIWEGMPDEPEPYTSIKDLPIYKEHPHLKLYRKFPYTKLMEQMYMPTTVSAHSKDEGKAKPRKYECFICGKEHEHTPTVEEF